MTETDIQTGTKTPKLIHKETRTFSLPNGQNRWETRCGLILDNALALVHSSEDMVKAMTNPHVLERKQTPCVGCMSEDEKTKLVDLLLENPESRLKVLRKMDQLTPGDPHVELALAYETNAEFHDWLNERVWKATSDGPAEG